MPDVALASLFIRGGSAIPYAHSRNAAGDRHDLGDHLRAVADLAAGFAAPFGGEEVAHLAGLLHDIGKAHPDWQTYLMASEKEPDRKHKTVDHKGAGAVASRSLSPWVAGHVQGHHGGLSDLREARAWLEERSADPHSAEGIAAASAAGLMNALPNAPDVAQFAGDQRGFELFLRLCFSALVDADRLDTEAHFESAKAAIRGGQVPAALSARLREH